MFLMLRTGYYLFRFISVFKNVLRIIGGQWYQLGAEKKEERHEGGREECTL